MGEPRVRVVAGPSLVRIWIPWGFTLRSRSNSSALAAGPRRYRCLASENGGCSGAGSLPKHEKRPASSSTHGRQKARHLAETSFLTGRRQESVTPACGCFALPSRLFYLAAGDQQAKLAQVAIVGPLTAQHVRTAFRQLRIRQVGYDADQSTIAGIGEIARRLSPDCGRLCTKWDARFGFGQV